MPLNMSNLTYACKVESTFVSGIYVVMTCKADVVVDCVLSVVGANVIFVYLCRMRAV